MCRGLNGERYITSLAGSQEAKDSEDVVISHSKSVSAGSVASSDGGMPILNIRFFFFLAMIWLILFLALLPGSLTKFYPLVIQSENGTAGEGRFSVAASSIECKSSINKDSSSISSKQSQAGFSPVDFNSMDSNVTSLTNISSSTGRTIAKEVQSSNGVVISEASNTGSNCSNLSMNIIDEGPTNESLDSGFFFQEGYCKVMPLSECPESTEVSFLDNNISPCDLEKSEDGDNDDMLGGVFAFSEEGTILEVLYEHIHIIS